MPDPFNNPSLFGRSVHGTSFCPSLALSSSSLGTHCSEGGPSYNSQGAVDINLALNSAPRDQAFPMAGQQGFDQHSTEHVTRRSDPGVARDVYVHSISDFHPMQQKAVNLNIFMGNNSCININLLSNNPSSHLARNNPFASSYSNSPIRSNIVNPTYSTFMQTYLTRDSNQETPASSLLEINPSPHFIRSYSQYTSTRVTTARGNLYSYAPNHNQNIFSSSCHLGQPSEPCQCISHRNHTIPQSSSDLNFSRLSATYYNEEKHLPALPSSTKNTPERQVLEFDGTNDESHQDEFHPQPIVPTPGRHPKPEHVSHQAPFENDSMTAPQRSLAQANSPNHIIELSPQEPRLQHTVRYKSHPYVKYGPYTCPHCHGVFQSSNSFAAHVQKHYRDESPAERKKRREGKIRKRDLHIAQSSAGITVMPGSIQLEETPQVTSIIEGGKATKSNHGEGFPSLKIKEEIKNDYSD